MSFHVNARDVKVGLFLVGICIAGLMVGNCINDLKKEFKERGGCRGLVIDAGKEVKGIIAEVNKEE